MPWRGRDAYTMAGISQSEFTNILPVKPAANLKWNDYNGALEFVCSGRIYLRVLGVPVIECDKVGSKWRVPREPWRILTSLSASLSRPAIFCILFRSNSPTTCPLSELNRGILSWVWYTMKNTFYSPLWRCFLVCYIRESTIVYPRRMKILLGVRTTTVQLCILNHSISRWCWDSTRR